MPATPNNLCLIRKDLPTFHPRLVVMGCGFPTVATLPFPVFLYFPEAVRGGGKGTVMYPHVALSMPFTMQFVSPP